MILQTTFQAAQSFIERELMSYLNKLCESVSKKQAICGDDLQLLHRDSCMVHLQSSGICEKELPVISELGKFGKYVEDLAKTVNKSIGGGLSPDDSQAALVEWNEKKRSLLAVVESTKNLRRQVFDELNTTADQLSTVLTSALQSCVNTQAVDAAKVCAQLLESQLAPGHHITEEKLAECEKHVEQAKMLSSVLGENGALLRKGLAIMQAAIICKFGFEQHIHYIGDMDTSSREKCRASELKGIKHLRPLLKDGETDKLRNELCACLKLMNYTPMKDGTMLEELSQAVVDLMKKLWEDTKAFIEARSNEFAEKHKELSGAASVLVLPDEITTISDAQHLPKMQPEVPKIFSNEATTGAAACCKSIEEQMLNLELLAQNMDCPSQEIFDIGKFTAIRQQTLEWLCLGFGVLEEYIFIIHQRTLNTIV